MEAKSSIRLGSAQELLESASNASTKGLGAFETPVELAGILRSLLPKYIEVITDFCAGHGNLAVGCADGTTTNLLLVDIQRLQTIKPENRPVYQTLDGAVFVGKVNRVGDGHQVFAVES